jgi:hypothetical protein
MPTQEPTLRFQIALGWIAILLVSSMDLIFGIIRSLLTESDRRFRSLRMDPGLQGIDTLVWFIAFYALMPIVISLVAGLRWSVFRWVAVIITTLEVLFMGAHHFFHWTAGDRPSLSSNVLDFSIHLLGLWILVNTVRWAQLRHEAAGTVQPHAQPESQPQHAHVSVGNG